MNSIDKLSEIFKHFPGIGPRQARRFVYYLLSRDKDTLKTLTEAIEALSEETRQCLDCKRYYPLGSNNSDLCPTCLDASRDSSLLMIVPRDADFESVEKSGGFRGYYFILGGVLPILEKEPEKKVRSHQLEVRVKNGLKNGLKEVILAMNANAEGENTAEFLKNKLKNFGLITTVLGRGLSTGAELEYADRDTLKNALLHRTK